MLSKTSLQVGRAAFLLIITFELASAAEPHLPAAAAAAGFTRIVFEDNFDEVQLDPSDQAAPGWYNGLWYEQPNPVENIETKDGTLVLRSPIGITHTSITTVPRKGEGGITFRHGYFEARMKFPQNDSDWAAFWLMSRPRSLGRDKDHWCEIDIFEHFGENIFVGAVHDWRTKSTNIVNPGAYHRLKAPVDFSAWHTYALLWTADTLTWYFDGEPIIKASPPFICEQQDLFLVLGSQKHKDGTDGRLEVDRVFVLSK